MSTKVPPFASEHWLNNKWRPMMAFLYMATCAFDFIVAPVLWSIAQSIWQGNVQAQWQPLTLQGGGLYHIAMGAILGVAAYGRTQEKLNGASNFNTTVGTTYIPPGQGSANVSNQATPFSNVTSYTAANNNTPVKPSAFNTMPIVKKPTATRPDDDDEMPPLS